MTTLTTLRSRVGAIPARSARYVFSCLVLALVLVGVVRSRAPRPLTTGSSADLSRFVQSNKNLGFDLYGRARQGPGNIAISPLAVSNAAVMLWAGARGETAAQIQNVLHAEGAAGKALETAEQVAHSLGDRSRKLTFRRASRLFVEKSHAPEPAHLAQFEGAFGAPVEPMDLGAGSEPSRQRINDWVAGQTENRIRDLIPRGAVTPDTTLVVASALYFHGNWKTRFSESRTWPAPFDLTPTEKKDVPTMHQEGTFRVAFTEGVGILELPYDGEEMAMTFVVPWGLENLAAVEDRLSPATVDRWCLALRPEKVSISVPRFEMNARLALGESLKALGMPLAFDRERADFTGIAGKGAFLMELFHQVYVKVDESGTEAAAATGGSFYKDAPPEFRVDQPFLFFVREVRSGLVLFMGRVSDPTAGVEKL